MSAPLRIPRFEYAPIKVTFKKKIRLADLTPVKPKNTVREFFSTVLITGMLTIILIVAILAMLTGEKYEDS